MSQINKAEFAASLARRIPELSDQDVRKATGLILETITRALAQGRRVEIRGFGSFNLHQHAACVRLNPKNNEEIRACARYAVRFKPAKRMREAINASKPVLRPCVSDAESEELDLKAED